MTNTRAQDVFYRLFGDFNADGRVNPTDTAKFSGTIDLDYLSSSGYLMYFDSNADGRINATDTAQYSARLGSAWSGFTATI